MRNKMLVMSIFFVLAAAVCVNAYAAGDVSAWHGFWYSVGGLLHSALPWNWGEWMHSS